MDLPGWQALHAELEPAGLTIVTVCMDVEGADAARPWVEAARPTHPSLLDVTHALGEQLGVVNIPNGTWIDEEGVIVRPAEAAWPGARPAPPDDAAAPPVEMPERIATIMGHAARIVADREAYADALRDWVAHGADSRFALSPEAVIARSQPRDRARAEAAAHFELAQWLHRSGRHDAAVAHFRAAHERQPENWTYKRQAWELESRVGGAFDRFWQGPVPGREADWPYPGDWLRDVEAIGAEQYYPRFEP
jgi:hypothetical protein